MYLMLQMTISEQQIWVINADIYNETRPTNSDLQDDEEIEFEMKVY